MNKNIWNSVLGFTLIELLIALTILMVLLSGVYLGFRGGMIVWKRDQDSFNLRYVTRIAFKNIEQNIRSTYFDKDNPETLFMGSEKSLTFIFVGKDGFIWQGNYYLTAEMSLEKSSLYFESSRIWHDNILDTKQMLMLERINEFKFKYYDGEQEQWIDTWQDDQYLPRAIKILITIEDKSVNNKMVSFEKIIFIPAADIINTSDLKK
ncbi:MAG: prepilin-type N-terminal cleavage/methylation domain-containing protein [Candidatus Omnitrophota bacterium]